MPVIIVIFVVVAIIAVILTAITEQKRRQALLLVAQKLGLMYSPEKDRYIDDRYCYLHCMNVGSDRYASNVMKGAYQGHDVIVFDYHYETGSGKERTTHLYSFFILETEQYFSELLITKEGIFSKITQALGFDDIDFESHEFSRKFCVKSKDKKFAYDFCNGQMIEYLLANSDLNIEVDRKVIAISFTGNLKPETVEYNLNRVVNIRSLMPDYLFESKS